MESTNAGTEQPSYMIKNCLNCKHKRKDNSCPHMENLWRGFAMAVQLAVMNGHHRCDKWEKK